MPRLIDHATREVEVAEAAWRVAMREGVRGLSVRSIAAEAGLATGSLRRAFPTQSALLAFSIALVVRRATARIRALPIDRDDPEFLFEALLQTLPLDAERRMEMEVFLVIGTASLSDPHLRGPYDAALDAIGGLCEHGIRSLLGAADATTSVVDLEAARLHALVDGLALHLVRQPESAPSAWAVEVLRHHLDAVREVLPQTDT